jgi:sigma-B regulation protein RsbU (phosphoserine phosphatase)
MAKKTQRQLDRNEQIYQLGTLVAGQFSLQEVLDQLAEAAVRITGATACSIRLLNEQAGELMMRSTYGLSEEYRNKGVVSKNDKVIKAAFSGEAVIIDDMRVDRRVKYKDAAIKEGLVSQLTVVMEFRSKAVGVLRLYSPKPKQFGQTNIQLARSVASQCAVAITNARLYAEAIEGQRIAEQMRLAGVVQRRMIPSKAPLIPGLDIAATYIPCFDVGGDFYDFFKVNDFRIGIGIADVIGKGIPAAIMMSWFKGAVRAYADRLRACSQAADLADTAEQARLCINDIVQRLNDMACDECRNGEFVTLFYAVIDTMRMTITYCNCGHEPAMLIRNGRIVELEKGGLVLGVHRQAEYDIETVDLEDGDALLFYTDGLTDAANFDGEFWGRENLLKNAKGIAIGSAKRALNNLLRYRMRFVGLARQIDDTSAVVVKVDRTAEPSFMKQGN